MSYKPKINIEGAGVIHVKSSEILKSDEAQRQLKALGELQLKRNKGQIEVVGIVGNITEKSRNAALRALYSSNTSKAAKTARGLALSQPADRRRND